MDELGSTSAQDLHAAQLNRQTFDATLEGYVSQKLAYSLKRLQQGERELWFDATDCVWCVFDDPAFVRREDTGLTGTDVPTDLQVYWSLGHVVMPSACDVPWVGEHIAQEAQRQLEELGYRCRIEHRTIDEIDDQPHVGVSVRTPGLLSRLVQRFS